MFSHTAAVAVVFALVLQRQVQAFHQAEEVAVTVGSQAIGARGHKVVGVAVGVAAVFRQHVGIGFCVVHHAVVTAVVE
ncbi:hypothetical protein D3C71_1428830 [compost metagenome]